MSECVDAVGLTFLFLLFCGTLAQSQIDPLLVRWNSTVLIDDSTDDRELIYHDEIAMTESPDRDGPGILACRIAPPTSSSAAGWRRPDDTAITTENINNDFTQYMVSYSSSTRIQLARARSPLLDGASNNGLWTCNGGGNPPRHVPLYNRGDGAVVIDSVSLGASPSFSSTSPSFTLIADSSGGPPTTSSWRNYAGTISNGGSNSISIEVNPNNDATGRRNCHYRSTLEVTAVAPGTYTYVASNRATSGDARMSFVVEGGVPSNLQVTGTGSNSVELTWDPPPGPPSGGYRVVDSGNSINMTTTSTSLTIDMLPPGVHNFRVTAISQNFPGGTVGPGTITISGAALAPVISLSPPTATSVTVSWTQSVLSMPVTSYDVAVRRLTDCNSVLPIRGPRRQAANDMTELFEDLGEYIDYRAEVYANFQSASSVRAELNFTTLAIAPSEVPSNVVPITTSRTISVSWDAIDCGNQNGPNFRYDVDFQQMDGGAVPVGTVNNVMFTMMGLQPFTNYTFRVRGINDAGNGDYTSLRTIETNGEAPEVPSNVRIGTVTSRTISVSWDAISPNGRNFHYEVDFQQTNGETAPDGEVNNEMFTVMGLQPFINYTFRVRGINDAGNGDYSSLLIIQTTAEAPEVPSNVRVGTVTSRAISVSWDAINPNGANFRYEVDFQRMDGGAVPVGMVNNVMFTVMGLQPFTNYTFRVRGVNDAGNGNYTNLRTIQTNGEVPGVPDSVMVLTVTSRTINVSWSAISPDGPNFRYEVDFQRMTGGLVPIGTVNDAMFTVIGLQPFINYTFRVRGVNDAGNGNYTSLITIQTNVEAPEVPSNVRVGTVVSRAISVFWDAISPNGANLHYEVDFQRMDGGAVPAGTVNNEMFTVMGLQPFTNYTFRVRGVNDAGNGDYSSLRTIQTNGEVPEVPNNVMVLTVTSRTINVSWSVISPNGPNFRYEVDFQRMDGGAASTGTVTNTVFSAGELQPFTGYTFRVRGVNDVGPGHYAPSRMIQTDQEAPSEVPSNVVPITTSRTISVSWDAIDSRNQNGANFRYEVNFQQMDGSAAPVGTVNNIMFIVEGLQPFTNYVFQVRGVNDAGNGNYTMIRVIQTNSEAPSEFPSNVMVLSLTSRTIIVSWDAIDSRIQNGPNFHYDVDFQRMDGGAVPVGIVDNVMFTVMGLQPFTNYTFRVRGVNDAGNGNYSNFIIIETNGEVRASLPEVPSNVRVSSVSSRSISVSWDAADIGNQNFFYEVEFQRLNGGAVPVGTVVNALFTVDGLQPFTNYAFRVRGVNEVGNGEYTDFMVIQTNQDKPEIVAGLETRLTNTYTSVFVSWSPPQEPNGIIIMYELTYRLAEQCLMSENITNQFNFTIDSEVNSRVTGIRVRAYTSVGPGPFAMTAPVTLAPSTVMNIQVESLTYTSVMVAWDRITDSPEIAEYSVYYAPVSSRQGNEQSVTVPSTENSVVISGLESTVEYQYQVTAVALVFGGLRLEGERSPVTDSARLTIMESATSDTSDVTVAVPVSVVVTFLFTIILNNAVLLIGYKVRAHHYKRSQDFITAETSGIELKENAAYDPVTSSEQPPDYIYAQPDAKIEGDYDIVK